ncbi:histidine phosphatase family protein [Pseudonocardia sp. NPDC046786]|uniref:histidine phosphatase family protein n=1 Tax=Pseudonocardia sp. NPDC046786 TaxID=3155471 RepID=UPI00340AA107
MIPPQVSSDDPEHPATDPRYAGVLRSRLLGGESLAAVRARVARVLPAIERDLVVSGRVLVVAHGNSLRALCMLLDRLARRGRAPGHPDRGAPALRPRSRDAAPSARRRLPRPRGGTRQGRGGRRVRTLPPCRRREVSPARTRSGPVPAGSVVRERVTGGAATPGPGFDRSCRL